MPQGDDAFVLTPSEAARRLLISDSALRAWRRSGQGPRFLRFGRAVRYSLADLEAFVRESAVAPGSPDQGTAARTSRQRRSSR